MTINEKIGLTIFIVGYLMTLAGVALELVRLEKRIKDLELGLWK